MLLIKTCPLFYLQLVACLDHLQTLMFQIRFGQGISFQVFLGELEDKAIIFQLDLDLSGAVPITATLEDNRDAQQKDNQ